MNPLLQFDVKPEARRSHFFTVTVWPTLSAMRETTETPGSLAVTHCYAADGDGHSAADIHFAKKYLTPATIVHECTHAILGWTRLVSIDISHTLGVGLGTQTSSNEEERICEAMERCYTQIVERLDKEGYTVQR